MIKKCKQCGCQLAPSENNGFCENCRKNKREKQLEAKKMKAERKKKKT